MAKKGFSINNLPNFLAPSADKAGWSLCIGAGTSAPIFPDWYSLAEKLAHNIGEALVNRVAGFCNKYSYFTEGI